MLLYFRPRPWQFAIAAVLALIFLGLMALGVDTAIPVTIVVLGILVIAAPQVLSRLGSLGDPPNRS